MAMRIAVAAVAACACCTAVAQMPQAAGLQRDRRLGQQPPAAGEHGHQPHLLDLRRQHRRRGMAHDREAEPVVGPQHAVAAQGAGEVAGAETVRQRAGVVVSRR
jgi:hypothetical protein